MIVQERNRQIEGLRAFAMLCVLVFHFFCRFQDIYMVNDGLPFPFTLLGDVGVEIFILISGFFFAQSSGGISFVSRRLKKLLPIYWISLVIIYGITSVYCLPGRTASFSDFLLNILCLGGIPNVASYVDGAHWFLRTMLVIVLIYSFVQRKSEKLRIISFFTIVFAVICMAVMESFIDIAILKKAIKFLRLNFSGLGLNYMIVAIMGSALSFIYNGKRKSGSLLLLLCTISHMLVFGFVISCVIVLLNGVFFLCLNNRFTFLEISPFQMMAKSSYSIYLIHQNIGYVIMLEFLKHVSYGVWLSFFVTIAMMSLGFLMHFFVERKLNNAISGFFKKFEKNGVAM